MSPARPLRFLDPPGPALLRQRLGWLRSESNPLAAAVARIAEGRPEEVLCLFDLPAVGQAVQAARALSAQGIETTAVRGRLLPSSTVSAFTKVSFSSALQPLLAVFEKPMPVTWTHPVIAAEIFHPAYAGIRLGAIFSSLPEPGVLDVPDLGRAGVREGAPPAALDQPLAPSELPALLDALDARGLRETLLVDTGGGCEALADELSRRRRLGAYFGPARRPPPAAVLASRCPVYTWFEPEDLDALSRGALPRVPSGCAWVPVGTPADGIAEATARLLAVRELGYGAVVPRWFVPVPNTTEWARAEAAGRVRVRLPEEMDGSRLVFAVPAFGGIEGPELQPAWTAGNRWPSYPASSTAAARRTESFRGVRLALDGYLRDAQGRVAVCHARDLLAELIAELGAGVPELQPLDEYPFVAFGGQSVLAIVQSAIERRLLSLEGVPEALLRAIQHAALAGGKRIRPVLVLTIACGQGADLGAALPAALATEWIHTASLIQDDLPCMDDDAIRRRDVSAHVRHGEAMALLASDHLIAMAFDDVAGLADNPAVGPRRAARMLRHLSRAVGASGLVGGQARDLLTRSAPRVGLQEVLDVHRHKTVPLFRLTASLGCEVAGASPETTARLEVMLESMGLAFQIVDDVLDATPDNDRFGRPAGSDRKNALPTFATLLGLREARRYADRILDPYLSLAAGQPGPAALTRLARYVLERRQ